MRTPIVDFVKEYIARDTVRGHMPGHKGIPFLGCEPQDITEFVGADSLYHASGIIAESEKNASLLFGCPTWYSTEGSSHVIRAMLYLVCCVASSRGERPTILAGRNAHSVFVSAAALLQMDVTWLVGTDSYLSCSITADDLEEQLRRHVPTAVYITSPDYLGNMVDVAALAAVCHRYGTWLVVDNAHGAYLRFLNPSQHPIDLGADIVCDSAHKTLPVLTGGAYLHMSEDAAALCSDRAKHALALFGSTSPSYLILQSLDHANDYLSNEYPSLLAACCARVIELKESLSDYGYRFLGDEPTKLTIDAKAMGYCGDELAEQLHAQGIVCEFFDPDVLVLMITPEIGDTERLKTALLSVERRARVLAPPPPPHRCEQAMNATAALFSESEIVASSSAVGRILCAPTVGCPPAVPIVMCGERIDEAAVERLLYYDIPTCCVVKNKK